MQRSLRLTLQRASNAPALSGTRAGRPSREQGSAPRRLGIFVAGVAALALQAGAASSALGDAVATGDKIKSRGHTAFSCEPARFEDEPHYVRVRMNGSMITSMHLLLTDDGEEVVTSHPYGTARAIITDDTRELCMKLDRLDRFVDRIERRQRLEAWLERFKRLLPPLPTAPESGAVAPGPITPGAEATAYNTGLLIGWNDSTGQTPGACYNFTTSTPSNNIGGLDFTSENAASSTAGQTKVSATASGAFGAFSASASFSYSDQWRGSANAGSAYFNISSIWTLNSVVDPTNPLTAQGANAGDQFATLCGVDYLASVPGGMVATLAVAYGSSSAAAKREIDAKFAASFGLDSLKGAVDVSTDSSDSSSYFNVRLFHQGGGVKASALLTSQFGATDPVTGDSYVDECANGDVDACEQFVSNMATGAIDAGNAFNSRARDPASGENLNFFALFPNGVAGVATTPRVTTSASSNNDVLEPYEEELTAYLQLLNEISTLNNRARNLTRLIGDQYAPIPLSLLSYLDKLTNSNLSAVSYASDRATLVDNLGKCLNATSSNVTEACMAIINNTIESAYVWYDATDGNPNCTSGDCWLAQQNTIALQYATRTGATDFWPLFPMDVLYIDTLPNFGSGAPRPSINGKAALIAFADRPWFRVGPNAGKTMDPNVSILALTNDTDLKDIQMNILGTNSGFYLYGLVGRDNWYGQSGDDGGARTQWTISCEPTFVTPCTFGFDYEPPTGSELARIFATFLPIQDMFTAN